MDQQGIKIRNATLHDMKLFHDWANNEHWSIPEIDIKPYYDIDPEGFFLGEINNEPVAMISSVCFDSYSHISFYIVKEEFRRKGYGLSIFQHAIKYAEKKVSIIGLDGVDEQKENYERSGFKAYDRLSRYTKKAQGSLKNDQGLLSDIHDISLEEIVEYDRNIFGSSRRNYIDLLLKEKVSGYAIKEGDRIQGYGILRKSYTGYKIAPLVADNREFAENILNGLQSLIEGEEVILDILQSNKEAENIVKEQGWEYVLSLNRMYKNGLPKNDTSKLFGVLPDIG